MSGLEVDAVDVSRGGQPVLQGLSLEASEGELVAIVGRSGAGKSTLLRAIAGLQEITAGFVRLNGRDLGGVPAEHRDIAMVFQSFALFPHLSVERNIGFGLRARGIPSVETRSRVTEIAEKLGVERLLERRPAQLSGGERQRVALARALVRRPQLLLLDEPLSNLDDQLRAEARRELRELHRQEGLTVLHVTHDQGEAMSLGERVAVLGEGVVLQQGSPDEIYERPACVDVAVFVGSPPMRLIEANVRSGEIAAGPIRIAARGSSDGPIIIGVRPEDVRLEPGGFRAKVVAIERVGREELIDLDAEGVRLSCLAPSGIGQGAATVSVRIPEERIVMFDPESGRRL